MEHFQVDSERTRTLASRGRYLAYSRARGADEPRGQGPGKGQGLESLNPARLGETGEQSQIPRDKDARASGIHRRRPAPVPRSVGPVAPTNFPAAEGRGSGLETSPRSLCFPPPAGVQPPPSLLPPQLPPLPNAPLFTYTLHPSSPLLLLPLAFLPHFSPLFFSGVFFCILSSLPA